MLHVIDTTLGQEIANINMELNTEFYLNNDKVIENSSCFYWRLPSLLYEVVLAGLWQESVSWKIHYFNGTFTEELRKSCPRHISHNGYRKVSVYRNFLIANVNQFLHFFDILSGELLITVSTSMVSGYDHIQGVSSAYH